MSAGDENADILEQNPPAHSVSTAAHYSPATSLEAETDSTDQHDTSDVDSAIGSWRSSRTQSLTSSVLEFQYENGRRYHAYREGAYHLPNDENEQDRLDLQHQLFRIALDGRLFLAPVQHPQDFLDVGCGTGIWCIDVADEYPQAQVLGFDLRFATRYTRLHTASFSTDSPHSPIQPQMIPPNCKFLVDDCNSDWVFEQRFDLIHDRAMTPGVKDWPRYLRQAYEFLKPGGYIELHELHCPCGYRDDGNPEKPDFVKWSDGLVEAGQKVNLDFSAAEKLDTMLLDAGFTNINIRWMNFPVGPWAKGAKEKQIGMWCLEDLVEVVNNTGALFTRILGWSKEEFDAFATRTTEEMRSRKRHTWVPM